MATIKTFLIMRGPNKGKKKKTTLGMFPVTGSHSESKFEKILQLKFVFTR